MVKGLEWVPITFLIVILVGFLDSLLVSFRVKKQRGVPVFEAQIPIINREVFEGVRAKLIKEGLKGKITLLLFSSK
jgi:hypothetical protein